MSIFKNIFVKNKDIPIVIDYVQGSNSIPIELNIEDWDVPSNAEARIYIRKPSGKEIYNSVTISTNTIKIKPTTQMFAEKGTNYGQIQIIKDKDILLSFILEFDVEENIINSSAIESKDEFNVLDGLINSARIEIEKAKKATADALAAKKAADTAATNANEAIKATQTATTNANNATANANNKVIEIQEKVDAGDFDGATFTPSVSKDGIISWQNDKGKQNPASVNIKGPKGDPGSLDNLDSQPIANVIKTANGSTVIPVAMQKFLNIGATNGPLIIELPVGFNGGIISFDIVISNNTDDDLVRYSIVGQLYTANGGTWTNETRAEASGMAKTDKDDLTVRFGYTANKEKAIIAIGDDSTTWQIPMITIRDFVVYFIKTDMSLWRNGWDCKIGKLSDYTWQRVQEHPNPLKISQETIDLFKSLGFNPQSVGGVLNSLVNFIFDRMHPIGSYYISDDNKNPETIFGGTWEKITDRFLYASGSKAVGNVGGEETHVLSGAELPTHTHPFAANSTSSGKHSHGTASTANNFFFVTNDGVTTSDAADNITDGNKKYKYPRSLATKSIAKHELTGTTGAHNHSVSGTTGATGSSKAHNNMPPYQVVNIWKRIA